MIPKSNTPPQSDNELLQATVQLQWVTFQPNYTDPALLRKRKYWLIAATGTLLVMLALRALGKPLTTKILPVLFCASISFALTTQMEMRFFCHPHTLPIQSAQTFLFVFSKEQVYILMGKEQQALPLFSKGFYYDAVLLENYDLRLLGRANKQIIDLLFTMFPGTETPPKRYREFCITFCASRNDIAPVWDKLPERRKIKRDTF